MIMQSTVITIFIGSDGLNGSALVQISIMIKNPNALTASNAKCVQRRPSLFDKNTPN